MISARDEELRRFCAETAELLALRAVVSHAKTPAGKINKSRWPTKEQDLEQRSISRCRS
jgi:hypothetical protein